jgi:hypothetical protein
MRGSTHARAPLASHAMSGAAQSSAQRLSEHTWPAAQRVPHPPQFSRSVVTSTQRPSQSV